MDVANDTIHLLPVGLQGLPDRGLATLSQLGRDLGLQVLGSLCVQPPSVKGGQSHLSGANGDEFG